MNIPPPGNTELQLGSQHEPPGNTELQLGPRPAPSANNPEQELGAPSSLRLLGHPHVPPNDSPRGWYRRLLPHRDEISLTQFITYRLADSIPQNLLTQLKDELESIPPEKQEIEYRKRIEHWLDAGYGSCRLRDPEAAQIVVKGWKHFDGERYDLIAWVVMPNHIHVLVKPFPAYSLAKIIQSWKSFTGKKILSLDQSRAGSRGSQATQPFWMREFWDRYMRDENHLKRTIDYIHNNPVKAGLVNQPEAWLWSSAYAATPGNTELQLGPGMSTPGNTERLLGPRPAPPGNTELQLGPRPAPPGNTELQLGPRPAPSANNPEQELGAPSSLATSHNGYAPTCLN